VDWTPELLDEREEVELKSLAKAVLRQVGQERYDEIVDNLLLSNQAEIMRGAPNNPARIRLEELLAKRDRGFE